jgi:hypothetical protein
MHDADLKNLTETSKGMDSFYKRSESSSIQERDVEREKLDGPTKIAQRLRLRVKGRGPPELFNGVRVRMGKAAWNFLLKCCIIFVIAAFTQQLRYIRRNNRCDTSSHLMVPVLQILHICVRLRCVEAWVACFIFANSFPGLG